MTCATNEIQLQIGRNMSRFAMDKWTGSLTTLIIFYQINGKINIFYMHHKIFIFYKNNAITTE